MNEVNRALVYATAAHCAVDQERKYTGEPYIVHPIEVMMLVRNFGGSVEMQQAALLHDVVEDCNVTEAELRVVFGPVVTSYVMALSDMEKGNRATRKALSRDRLGAAQDEVHTIKLADLYSNTRTIVGRDPGFSRVYFPEKVQLMAVLTRGNRALFSMVWDQIPLEYRGTVDLKSLL